MYPSPPSPFGNYKFVFSVFLSLCFANKFTYIFFFLDFSHKWHYTLFLFLWLTSLSMKISVFIHVAANGIISFFFKAE